jgi:SdrD B-like domain
MAGGEPLQGCKRAITILGITALLLTVALMGAGFTPSDKDLQPSDGMQPQAGGGGTLIIQPQTNPVSPVEPRAENPTGEDNQNMVIPVGSGNNTLPPSPGSDPSSAPGSKGVPQEPPPLTPVQAQTTTTPPGASYKEEPCETDGSISGRKFLDQNQNKIMDEGEAGIPGVQIMLKKGDYTDYRTTDGNGIYHFDGLKPGLYEVSVVEATVPEGHYHTNSPWRMVFLGPCCMNRSENFGNAICNSSISGRKWEDKDTDGEYSFPDRPMPGIEIQLWQGGQLIDSRLTSDDPSDRGSYCFDHLLAGKYTVREAAPSTYFCTNPTGGEWAVDLKAGEDRSGVNFLNARSFSISGTKWEWKDENGDGSIQDDEKQPVEGLTVQLSSALLPGVVEARTGADGKYTFKDLRAGIYNVKEVLTQDWYPVDTPDGSRVVELPIGSDLGGVDFINARYGSISGTKWEWIDYSENAQIDGGEIRPVKDVEIKLIQDGKEVLPSTRTNEVGGYSFSGLKHGAYSVEEVLTEGWSAISPSSGTREVILKSGMNATKVDFLNSRVTLVAGETITPPNDPSIEPIAGETLPSTGLNQLPIILTGCLFLLLGLIALVLGIIRSRSA